MGLLSPGSLGNGEWTPSLTFSMRQESWPPAKNLPCSAGVRLRLRAEARLCLEARVHAASGSLSQRVTSRELEAARRAGAHALHPSPEGN